MDCPHCGEENLLGAVSCMACGGNMFAPPSGMAVGGNATAVPERRPSRRSMSGSHFDEDPRPPPRAEAPVGVRCRVCLDPFERPAGDPSIDVCPSCRNIGTRGADLGENQVELAYQPDVHEEYTSRLGNAELRPAREMNLKVGVRWGRVAILIGVALSVVGMAVVKLTPENDRTSIYFRDVREVETNLVVNPPEDKLVDIQSDFNLFILHEAMKASFVGDLVPKLELNQHSRHTCQLRRQRETPHGVLVDLHTENMLVEQHGMDRGKEATALRAYPWGGRISTHRAVVSIDKPARTETGALLLPGVEVAPLMTLASVNAPDALIQPGKKWLASIELPLLANSQGRLMHATFPCRLYYQGRKLVGGYDCVALKITGQAPKHLPEVAGKMNRTGGQLIGALFYDAESGLIVRAHLDVDIFTARDRGRLEEKITVRGQLRIER